MTAAIAALLLAACASTPPLPTPGNTTLPTTATPNVPPTEVAPPSPSPSQAPKDVGPLDLEACDPLGHIPCENQALRMKLPLAGTGVSLVYSSECAAARLDRPATWDPADLGLGGWSLDVIHRYDAANRIDIRGPCNWRFADTLDVGGGDVAAPSFDGRRAYVFDAAGRHVRTVDAVLGVDLLTFTYDADGRISSVNGSLDDRAVWLTVERRDDGTPTALVGMHGARTGLTVDGAGRLSAVANPDGSRDQFVTDDGGLVALRFDRGGGLSTFDYDESGRLTRATDPDGVALEFARESAAGSLAITVTLPSGAVMTTSSSSTDTGLVKAYTTAGGAKTSVLLAPTGERTVTLPDGTTQSIGATADPVWGMSAPVLTPIVTRRPDGTVRSSVVGRAVETADGDLLHPTGWSRTIDIDGARWTEQLQPSTRTLMLSDPAGRQVITTYDERGRLVAREAPGQPAAAFQYDDDGRLLSDTRGRNEGRTTSYSYADDGTVSETLPDGTTEVTELDPMGRVVRQTAGDGSTVLTTYNSIGDVVLTRTGGSQATTEGWTEAGHRAGIVPPVTADDSSYEVREYGEGGLLARVEGPGERSLQYTYDEAGRVVSVAFDRGTLNATYDPATGALASVSDPAGVDATYDYTAGTRTSVRWSGAVSGSVAIELDALEQVIGEAVNGATPVQFTYDPSGMLTGVGPTSIERDPISGLATAATLGGARLTWSYDTDGRLLSAVVLANGEPLLRLDYGRDVMGRISSRIEAVSGVSTRIDYSYDGAGRLAGVTRGGTQVERNTYDGAGNRISSSGPTGLTSAQYDARNQQRLWGDEEFSYTAAGTLSGASSHGQSTSYDFDSRATLRGVTLADGTSVEYLVDWTGRRLGRKVNGELTAAYLYRPDGTLIAELDGNGQLVSRFGYDDRGHVLSIQRRGVDYLVLTDQVGSPRLVVDAQTGAIAQALEYDAWGNLTSDSSPGFQPLGFAGGLSDPDTGLLHFGARDYSPAVGRWLSPDPIRLQSDEPNFYVYSGNDPINRSDPSGLQPEPIWPPTKIGCFEEGGEQICYTKDENTGETTYDLPPGGKFWFCEDGICYLCGSGIHSQNDCDSEPNEGGADEPEVPAPSPPKSPGSCVFAIYCGNHTCVALICKMPGGGYCFGYCSTGDPHFRTADRLSIDFQGAGEYVMVETPDGGLSIQARQEPPPGQATVTLTTAVAAKVGSDRVGVYVRDGGALLVNGTPLAGIDVSRPLASGGSVSRHGSEVSVDWPDGSRLSITLNGTHLDYSFTPDDAIAPTLIGLLGTPNADTTDDLVSRDRALVLDPADPDFSTELHGSFGNSWRVPSNESAFDYLPGETTATFTLPNIPGQAATIDTLDQQARDDAEAICRAAGIADEPALSSCIIDYALTGDPSYVSSAAAVAAAEPAAPPAAAATPIVLGQTVAGAIVDPAVADRYTFAGNAGQAVYLDALGACATDLSWKVRAPSDSTSDQRFVCEDVGRYELPETGTYTVEVFAPTGSADTGTYVFVVRPASATPPPTPIAIGQPVSGNVAQIGDQPSYAFDGTAGQEVLVDASGPCVDGLSYRILDPNGSVFAFEPTCSDTVRRSLPVDGTYVITIVSTEAVTGEYAFAVVASP